MVRRGKPCADKLVIYKNRKLDRFFLGNPKPDREGGGGIGAGAALLGAAFGAFVIALDSPCRREETAGRRSIRKIFLLLLLRIYCKKVRQGLLVLLLL
jgi:hypothetical protein